MVLVSGQGLNPTATTHILLQCSFTIMDIYLECFHSFTFPRVAGGSDSDPSVSISSGWFAESGLYSVRYVSVVAIALSLSVLERARTRLKYGLAWSFYTFFHNNNKLLSLRVQFPTDDLPGFRTESWNLDLRRSHSLTGFSRGPGTNVSALTGLGMSFALITPSFAPSHSVYLERDACKVRYISNMQSSKSFVRVSVASSYKVKVSL